MQDWKIRPFEGIGPLEFGTPRATVRELLGEDFDTFRKRSEAFLIDSCDSLGLHLYYDEQDWLKSVVTFSPCMAEVDGFAILGHDQDVALDAMGKLGYEATEDPSGHRFDSIGVILYVPYEGKVESVVVLRTDEFEESIRKAAEIMKRRERRSRLPPPPDDPFGSIE